MKCTREETQLDRLRVGNMQIDRDNSLSYIGRTVDVNKTLVEAIAKGNNAFYANKTLFKSKMVSRKYKLKFCWSVIRPIVFLWL